MDPRYCSSSATSGDRSDEPPTPLEVGCRTDASVGFRHDAGGVEFCESLRQFELMVVDRLRELRVLARVWFVPGHQRDEDRPDAGMSDEHPCSLLRCDELDGSGIAATQVAPWGAR